MLVGIEAEVDAGTDLSSRTRDLLTREAMPTLIFICVPVVVEEAIIVLAGEMGTSRRTSVGGWRGDVTGAAPSCRGWRR